MATGTVLQLMRKYFNSGSTLSYDFRRSQLTLQQKVHQYETHIGKALYDDLNKSLKKPWK